MIQILGPLGMCFDAVVVEVKTFLLLFRLALVILCTESVYFRDVKIEPIMLIILTLLVAVEYVFLPIST